MNIYKLIYLNSSQKEKLKQDLKEDIKLLKKMNDKDLYFAELKKQKEKIEKKLEKLELVLDDSKLLEKQYIKANSKIETSKQIKSLKKYKLLLEKEKDKNVKELENVSDLLKNENYQKKKEYLKKAYEVYSCKQSLDEVLIESQQYLLQFIDKRLSKMQTRDEIIDVLCELRYYKTLRISKNVAIKDIEVLNKQIDKIMKKAITLLCKIGAIKIVSMDINLNFEIIKYALDTKIMEIEKTKLYFDEDEQGLIIKVFDKDIIEKQGRKKVKLSKDILEVKLRRKVKLFS